MINIKSSSGSVTTANDVNGTTEIEVGQTSNDSSVNCIQVYDIGAPNLSSDTSLIAINGSTTGAYSLHLVYGNHTASTAATGFNINTSVSVTGKIWVYGYAKA